MGHSKHNSSRQARRELASSASDRLLPQCRGGRSRRIRDVDTGWISLPTRLSVLGAIASFAYVFVSFYLLNAPHVRQWKSVFAFDVGLSGWIE